MKRINYIHMRPREFTQPRGEKQQPMLLAATIACTRECAHAGLSKMHW